MNLTRDELADALRLMNAPSAPGLSMNQRHLTWHISHHRQGHRHRKAFAFAAKADAIAHLIWLRRSTDKELTECLTT
ncbi:hypothetical protein PQS90_05010 [Pseudomonas sp. BLCC-B13]|uniref:hypothetical protein n=1 Tax=Pseudomonas sp. BLCC-B13 TaxID=3025314 RepID=UPI00234E98DE|nr:hypothetical protein [Pseudomonas sp. BLCC-B13]MDC7824506.1 hypothetical protein [Pseudomonas sp. BLCC-B13]